MLQGRAPPEELYHQGATEQKCVSVPVASTLAAPRNLWLTALLLVANQCTQSYKLKLGQPHLEPGGLISKGFTGSSQDISNPEKARKRRR